MRHRHRTAIVQAHGHPDHRQRSVCACGAYRLWVTLAVAPWRGRVAGPWHPADETSPPRPDGTPRARGAVS